MKATLFFLMGFIFFQSISAQNIGIKTIPVATGDQFLLFPAPSLGIGGVSIALDDPMGDAFVNPARGARLEGTHLFSSPMFYTIAMEDSWWGSGNSGSAQTFPFGVHSKSGQFFGGGMVAWQQLNIEREELNPFWGDPLIDIAFQPGQQFLQSLHNMFGFVTGGYLSKDGRLAVGGSILGGELNGLEGVRMLYWGGDDVDQEGRFFNYRLGVLFEPDAMRTVDAVVLHHRFKMDHYFNPVNEQEPRTEQDETSGLGVKVGYQQILEEGWQAGFELAGNWQWHPKIPNYDIMQIPRDPGNSSAYNLGIGLARKYKRLVMGFDIIYEPIRSHTWADAIEDIYSTPIDAGEPELLVRAGDMTVENHFRFNNRRVRAGLERLGERFDWQLGVNVHTIRYHLDQTNYVEQFDRGQSERWNEWTLSGGMAFRFESFEIRYLGRVLLGTGQPFTEVGCWDFCALEADFAANQSRFIVAPNGNLFVNEARVITHQFTISVPLNTE